MQVIIETEINASNYFMYKKIVMIDIIIILVTGVIFCDSF